MSEYEEKKRAPATKPASPALHKPNKPKIPRASACPICPAARICEQVVGSRHSFEVARVTNSDTPGEPQMWRISSVRERRRMSACAVFG